VHTATAADAALYARALDARRHAYAPYSKLDIGAALVAGDGSVITAANVECASYGLSICAERVAAASAVAAGHRVFSAIAVAGPTDTLPACGACRQLLAEFADAAFRVTWLRGGELVSATLEELLPERFAL
jgi:cytidine deaminase